MAPASVVGAPARLLSSYRGLSIPALGPKDAAFRMEDGTTMSRGFMVDRTKALLAQAAISVVDDLGQPMVVRLASWRAGGVRSALDWGIPPPLIKAMGRWRSDAWQSYVDVSLCDIRKAAELMWSEAPPPPRSSLVGIRGSGAQLPAVAGDDVRPEVASGMAASRRRGRRTVA